MWEQDAGGKASRKFATSSALEMGRLHTDDPQQGARLVRAFLRITDQGFAWRSFRWSRRSGLLLPRIVRNRP